MSRLPDQILKWGLPGWRSAILALLLVYFFIVLIGQSKNAFSTFGLKFIFGNDWNVAQNIYHGAAACRRDPDHLGDRADHRGPDRGRHRALHHRAVPASASAARCAMLVDLLAAVPSVVYGLWGVFVLIPKLLPAEKWFASTFSFIPWIGGGTVDRAQRVHRRADPRDHDPADRLGDLA